MHRTLPLCVRCGECARLHSPDVGTVSLQRPVLTWRVLKHRTLKPASGARRPVQCRIANLSAHESGGHRTRPMLHKERPVTPRRAHIARAQGLSAAVFSSSSSRPSPNPLPPSKLIESAAPSAFPLATDLL